MSSTRDIHEAVEAELTFDPLDAAWMASGVYYVIDDLIVTG